MVRVGRKRSVWSGRSWTSMETLQTTFVGAADVIEGPADVVF
jgi:hypothetical protein